MELDCGSKEDSSAVINVEGDSSYEEIFVCEECNENFPDDESLSKHREEIHSGNKLHTCTVCGKTFSVSNNLKRHMLVHTQEKPHTCPLCQQSFSQPNHLTIHLRRHFDDKPFQCPDCSKCFFDSGTLKIHSRIHSGEKPYPCDLCEKKFSQKGNLEKHMKIHADGVKTFKCTYCEKVFPSYSNLQSHLRIHNPENMFECTYCGKRYSSFSGQYKHVKLHESKGEFIAFKSRLPVSDGEKKFQCFLCGRKFQTYSGHYKHMKLHNRNVTVGDDEDGEDIPEHESVDVNESLPNYDETDNYSESGIKTSMHLNEARDSGKVDTPIDLNETRKIYVKEGLQNDSESMCNVRKDADIVIKKEEIDYISYDSEDRFLPEGSNLVDAEEKKDLEGNSHLVSVKKERNCYSVHDL